MRNQHPADNNPVAKAFRDTPGKLLEGEHKLEFDLIPVPCCRIDSNTIIHDCNNLFADLLGQPKVKLMQTSFVDFVDRSSYPLLEDILTFHSSDNLSAGVQTKTVRLKKSAVDKAVFPCSLSFRPITDIRGKQIGNVIVIIDETLNRRTIESLEKDRYELRKDKAMQDEFIAVASHELKTPIQPILGFAYMAKKGLMSEEKAWDGVLEEARKLQHMANDILDVSRIETGTLSYEMRKEKINILLTSITDSVKNELQKDGVSIVLAYDEAQAELEVEADRARITQLINNLLGNAIKFTERGTIRVECKAFPDENKIEIILSDTGKGISKEVMPKLFEKFVTKGHGTVENNKGTGLGLYISKAIVKAHGGEISAFNNKDGGATFLIVLPISQNPRRKFTK